MNDFEKKYRVLENVNQWIFNCDTKTSIFLAAIGVLFTVLMSSEIGNAIVNIIRECVKDKSICCIVYLCLGLSGFLGLGLGIYKLIRVLIPSINLNHDSIMFFGNVARYQNFSHYCNVVATYNDDSINEDLLHQIYAASKICNQKFENYKNGIIITSIGGVIVLVWLILGFIVYYI